MKNERGNQMKRTQELVEESKQDTKAKLDALVDEYYKKYQDAGNNRCLNINLIEQFLIDCKFEVDKIIKEASSDILKKMEGDMIEKKKTAPIVERD